MRVGQRFAVLDAGRVADRPPESRTDAGDAARLGSGGADATIGAGSTITKPAPPGKLTVERSRQVTVESWKRPEKKPK